MLQPSQLAGVDAAAWHECMRMQWRLRHAPQMTMLLWGPVAASPFLPPTDLRGRGPPGIDFT